MELEQLLRVNVILHYGITALCCVAVLEEKVSGFYRCACCLQVSGWLTGEAAVVLQAGSH